MTTLCSLSFPALPLPSHMCSRLFPYCLSLLQCQLREGQATLLSLLLCCTRYGDSVRIDQCGCSCQIGFLEEADFIWAWKSL